MNLFIYILSNSFYVFVLFGSGFDEFYLYANQASGKYINEI